MGLAILWQSSGQDSVLPLWELRFDTDLGNQEPTKKIKYKKTTLRNINNMVAKQYATIQPLNKSKK